MSEIETIKKALDKLATENSFLKDRINNIKITVDTFPNEIEKSKWQTGMYL